MEPYDTRTSRLSAADLAREADTTPGRVARLVEAGIIDRAEDGSFGAGDIHRAKLVAAFEGVGISIDQLADAIRDRHADIGAVEVFYPRPSRRSTRTYEAFLGQLGDRGALVPRILAALGLAEPSPDGSLSVDDEKLVEAFLTAWDLGDDEVAMRAARIIGDGVRRVVEGWVDLFYEQVSDPVQRRMVADGLPVDAMIPEIVPAAGRISDLVPAMLDWLLARHLELVLQSRNISSAEEQFVALGLMPPRPLRPPAIAFADLSGFTSLTEVRGDLEGVRIAVRLGELADAAARRHRGRLVKLLGDGALLRFDGPDDAVAAALDLVTSAAGTGLPPVHIGIDAGPVITRDGDVFGHTVNVAARVAGVAGPGEVVVTRAVVDAVGDVDEVSWDPLGPASLKGVIEPVELVRVRTARPPPGSAG